MDHDYPTLAGTLAGLYFLRHRARKERAAESGRAVAAALGRG